MSDAIYKFYLSDGFNINNFCSFNNITDLTISWTVNQRFSKTFTVIEIYLLENLEVYRIHLFISFQYTNFLFYSSDSTTTSTWDRKSNVSIVTIN